jgi:hypothetical protein
MAQSIVDTGRVMGAALGIPTKTLDGLSIGLEGASNAAASFRSFAAKEITDAAVSMGQSFDSIAGDADDSAIDASNSLAQIPDEYAGAIADVQAQTTQAFNDIVSAAESSGADAATQAASIREQVASMMQGFDQPEQFAALINSITETGNEAMVGAGLLEQMGTAAARGSTEAQAAAETAKTAIAGLGSEAQQQADAANSAINNAFQALSIDVAQSLTGVNSQTQQTFDLIATGAKSVAASSYDAADKAKLLASLFSQGLGAAKTADEFKVLNDMVRAHGLSSVVTAEQQKVLQAGMQGGAEAAKAAADANAAQTAELDKNAIAAEQNAEKTRDVANAKDEQAAATDKASAADMQANATASSSLNFMQQVEGAIKTKISALEQMGATTEQTDATWQKLMASMSMEGKQYLGLQDFANDMERVDAVITKQISSFEQAKSRADSMTQALGSASVNSRDLADAQHALRTATDASVQGIVRMDQQTLNNLEYAIDRARDRMKDLADQASGMVSSLEAQLARAKGDDNTAREIEQREKLADIQEKINLARKRGNDEEVQQLNRALDLQKQINNEADKKAAAQAADDAEKQREKDTREREARERDLAQRIDAQEQRAAEKQRSKPAPPMEFDIPKPAQTTSNSNTGSISASDVANTFADLIEQAKKDAVQDFAKQLQDEAKRRT